MAPTDFQNGTYLQQVPPKIFNILYYLMANKKALFVKKKVALYLFFVMLYVPTTSCCYFCTVQVWHTTIIVRAFSIKKTVKQVTTQQVVPTDKHFFIFICNHFLMKSFLKNTLNKFICNLIDTATAVSKLGGRNIQIQLIHSYLIT